MINKREKIEADSLDLFEILFTLWKDKIYIILLLILFFVGGVFYLKNSTFTFNATLQVTPTERFSTSAVQTQIGGLANLIGITNSKSSSIDPFLMYKSLIKSRLVASYLSQDTKLLSKLFPDMSEKLITDGFEISEDTTLRKNIKGFLGLPSHRKKIELVDIIFSKTQNINIATDIDTRITTLSLDTTEPKLGIIFLESLHSISDNLLRKKSIDRTNEYIGFLNKQLSFTEKQDQRLALISTLAEQQRNKMIASSNMAFAAELFGDPYHSSAPTKPRIRNVLMTFLIVGFFAGAFFSIGRYYLKSTRT